MIKAWAFATAGQSDDIVLLFAALATAAERLMGELNSQELANTAWAFARACQKDASLLAALATAVQQGMGNFIPKELANTAWAFATAGQ